MPKQSFNVSDSTVDFYQAQGINLFYASMAATATYDFIMDINPPRAHIERKALLKSDTLDFTFGEWTYYATPFGNYKSKMKPRGKRLIERIVDHNWLGTIGTLACDGNDQAFFALVVDMRDLLIGVEHFVGGQW